MTRHNPTEPHEWSKPTGAAKCRRCGVQRKPDRWSFLYRPAFYARTQHGWKNYEPRCEIPLTYLEADDFVARLRAGQLQITHEGDENTYGADAEGRQFYAKDVPASVRAPRQNGGRPARNSAFNPVWRTGDVVWHDEHGAGVVQAVGPEGCYVKFDAPRRPAGPFPFDELSEHRRAARGRIGPPPSYNVNPALRRNGSQHPRHSRTYEPMGHRYAKATPAFQKGDRVAHALHGKGTIQTFSPSPEHGFVYYVKWDGEGPYWEDYVFPVGELSRSNPGRGAPRRGRKIPDAGSYWQPVKIYDKDRVLMGTLSLHIYTSAPMAGIDGPATQLNQEWYPVMGGARGKPASVVIGRDAEAFVEGLLRAQGRKNPSSGTVAAFLAVLDSKLTQYDVREQKKHHNIYRLGHLLKAADAVRVDLKKHLNDDSPAALAKLKQSIAKHFILPFSPASAVIKQIDAYLTSGRQPSLLRNPGGR